jgi:hypothetical protein
VRPGRDAAVLERAGLGIRRADLEDPEAHAAASRPGRTTAKSGLPDSASRGNNREATKPRAPVTAMAPEELEEEVTFAAESGRAAGIASGGTREAMALEPRRLAFKPWHRVRDRATIGAHVGPLSTPTYIERSMERRSIEAITGALNGAGVRYLVVGGLAVVAHGFVRFTADLDLVLEPDPQAMLRAVEALSTLGYRPRAPVDFRQFADPGMRAAWRSEKGLTVFSTSSPRHPATEIDLFLEAPFDFEAAYRRAARRELSPGTTATFVSLADLLDMKRAAGRPQDLQDVERLSALDADQDKLDE